MFLGAHRALVGPDGHGATPLMFKFCCSFIAGSGGQSLDAKEISMSISRLSKRPLQMPL